MISSFWASSSIFTALRRTNSVLLARWLRLTGLSFLNARGCFSYHLCPLIYQLWRITAHGSRFPFLSRFGIGVSCIVPALTSRASQIQRLPNIIPKCARLLLLPPAPASIPAIIGNTLRMPPATFSVAAHSGVGTVSRIVLHPPLIRNTLALGLVTKRVSFSLPFVSSTTEGRFGIQDSKLSFVRITGLPVTDFGFSRNEDTISKDGVAIKEVKEDLKDMIVSSSHQEETFEVSSSQDIPVDVRFSRLPLLQHVTAAALLRKLQLKVVEDLCYASIGEVVEDDKSVQEIEAVEVVDNVSTEDATENVTQEATGVGPVEEIEKLVVPDVAEDTQAENVVEDTTQTLVVEASFSPPSPEEKKIEVVSTDPAFVVLLFEELELPSYEQFVEDAPPEPLFEKSAFAPLIHVIHRPPPLAILAIHTRVKPCEPQAPSSVSLPVSSRACPPPWRSLFLYSLSTIHVGHSHPPLHATAHQPKKRTGSFTIAAANGIRKSTWTHVV
ncbi:hypothetical protein MVEN_01192300 [Mycena venus]|uniref:Uncharacterized protein n=1 Tax=Mycena venus TaxID=2733690 RepID=A0A8H7CY65_9AGAR|nr:hypothetical protein MVEN_01192300 [Mycena venus]